jgi:hypothetical protein
MKLISAPISADSEDGGYDIFPISGTAEMIFSARRLPVAVKPKNGSETVGIRSFASVTNLLPVTVLLLLLRDIRARR